MDNKKELNMEEMNKVAGGVWREINTGVSGLDAALRAEPKKSSRQIGHIANGVMVDTVSDKLVLDEVTGRHYVQVNYGGKIGWVASSILGLPR